MGTVLVFISLTRTFSNWKMFSSNMCFKKPPRLYVDKKDNKGKVKDHSVCYETLSEIVPVMFKWCVSRQTLVC